MPTYEYECQTCHERLEAVQKFADSALTTCPRCAGELRKVFSAVGIVFKGSGFYKNDSRATSKTSTTPVAAPSDATSASVPAVPAATPATPATPAPAPSASTSSSSSGD